MTTMPCYPSRPRVPLDVAGFVPELRALRKCRFLTREPSCIVKLYTRAHTMAAEKTISMSFRVSPKFKALLEVAATRENRSLTNMLETLLFAHCEQHGLSV